MFSLNMRRSLALLAAFTLLIGSVSAQTSTWGNAAGGMWSVGGNWDVAPVSGNTTALVFGSLATQASSYTATNDIGPFTLNSLTFNNNAGTLVTIGGANALTFAGTTPAITMGAGNATITPAVNLGATTMIGGGGGTLTFNGAVNDGGGNFTLVQNSTGTTSLTAGGSFGGISVQAGAVTIPSGTLALTNPTGAGNVSSGIQIGAASGQTGTVTISGGATVNYNENVYIGDAAGTSGTLNVSGAGTSLNWVGSASGRFAVGNSGNGALNITNGAAVSARFLLVDRTAAAGTRTGSVLVDGAGSMLTLNSGATLAASLSVCNNVANSTGTMTVSNGATLTFNGLGSASGSQIAVAGANGSTATMTISGGSTANLTGGNFFVGAGAGAVGTLNVTTGSSLTLTSGVLVVADGGNGGSTGNVNFTGGSTVNLAGMTLAQNQNTTSTGVVDNATLTVTGQLAVAAGFPPDNTGTTPQGGAVGTLTIQNKGVVNAQASVFLGVYNTANNSPNPAANGTITVTGAGSALNLSGAVATNSFQIGSGTGTAPGSGTGTVKVLNGGTVTSTIVTALGNINTGGNSGNGTLTVDGAGSSFTSSAGLQAATNVGGVAAVNVTNGGTLTLGATAFFGVDGTNGTLPNATGTLNVSGLGSTFSVKGGSIILGGAADSMGNPINPGGTGNLNVSAGGNVTATNNIIFAFSPASSATAVVSGGGSLVSDGEMDIALGSNGSLTINSGGTVVVGGNAFQSVNAAVTTGNITLNGFNSSFNVFGQLQVGGSGGTVGGTATLTANDMTVVAVAGPMIVYATGTVNVNTGPVGLFEVGGLQDGVTGTNFGTVAVGTGSTLTINSNGNNTIFTGVISGAGGIAKTGLGTQTLAGANTFTGPVAVNGGVLSFANGGNLGAGTVITFNGGTLQWQTGNTTDISSRTVTIAAGGAGIDIGSNNVTLAGVIGGIGGLVKFGSGTLTLSGTNTYIGGTNIQNGTVSVGADANLGTGSVTGGPLGTLAVTTSFTTTKSVSMNGGAVTVASGQTLTLNGGTVAGTTLDGPGSYATDATNGARFVNVSTTPSATLLANSGTDSLKFFNNGGTLNVAANIPTASPVTLSTFTNQGSGTVNVGASTFVNASNFQTSGVTNILFGTAAAPTQVTNNGSSPMFFNGGSRTFISIPAHAGMFDAGIDLHGNNAVVSGGLFVNNGYVVDSFGAGTKTVISDYGALVKGAGFYQNSVQTVNGGKFQSGNSPGKSSFGTFTFGTGGVTNYNWQINDPGPSPMFPSAPGIAGGTSNVTGQPDFGWSLIAAIKVGPSPGNFNWTATAASPLTVILQTLTGQTTVGNDVLGPMQNFDNTHNYSWQFVTWAGNYTGPTDTATLNAGTIFDQSSGPFANQLPPGATFGWSLKFNSGTSGPGELDLNYTVVPEPGTLALTGLAGLGIGWLARRRRKAKDAAAAA
jgi:T5SS/PEP-CTERM-associated repeat protein